jgi:uncharacterized protein (TIGR03435 family)
MLLPRSPIYTHGAVFFSIVAVGRFACLRFSSLLNTATPPYLPYSDRTNVAGAMHTTANDFMPELPLGVPIDTLPPEMPNRPRFLDALREQLGLRLESGKGPVENYMIDHVDKPSEN